MGRREKEREKESEKERKREREREREKRDGPTTPQFVLTNLLLKR